MTASASLQDIPQEDFASVATAAALLGVELPTPLVLAIKRWRRDTSTALGLQLR